MKKLNSMLKMASDYLEDAKYFLEKGDLLRAYGAINYSHAWIDAGVRIGYLMAMEMMNYLHYHNFKKSILFFYPQQPE